MFLIIWLVKTGPMSWAGVARPLKRLYFLPLVHSQRYDAFSWLFLEVVIEHSIIKLERQLGQQSGCCGGMKTWG